MQHVNRRRHKQAPIHFSLQLAGKSVPGGDFTHFVEQLAIFVKEIHALEVFLLHVFVEPKRFFFKAIEE